MLLGSLLEYIGDSNLKFFARTNNYGVGVASYISMTTVLVSLLKISNVMYTNVVWEGLGLILESSLAFFLLNETLSNIYIYINILVLF